MVQSNPKYYVLDKELENLIINAKKSEQENWLFMEPHPDFPGQWRVDSLVPSFQLNLQDEIGHYRAVSPARLESFLEVVREFEYKLVFVEDPASILNRYEHLNDPPSVKLLSNRSDTINGFIPFQAQGFNKLKDLDAGIAMWSTGTGKTALASGLLLYHSDMDLQWYIVQGDKKTNAARTIKQLAGLDSIILSGTRQKCEQILADLESAPKGTVVVTNYEKFHDYSDWIQSLFTDKEIFIIWDEMPTKLKNRKTSLYRSLAKCLYTSASDQASVIVPGKERPKKLKQLMMTATPIERAPEDFFNCVRLLSPTIFGTVKEFRAEYVKSYNYFNQYLPEEWHNLEKIGLLTAHIMHQVDKEDKDVAKYFPKSIPESVYIPWTPEHRKVYDIFTDEIKKRRKSQHTEKADLDDQEIFALIGVMQMLCDAPTMVSESAAQREKFSALWELFTGTVENSSKAPVKKGSEAALRLVEALDTQLTNKGHPKLKRLLEDLTINHPDEKVIVFTVFGELLLPILSEQLDKWKIPHVIYRGTAKQKQDAEDRFKSDPDIRVFLSSDAGAEGLDLPEASVSIDYDLPWNWSRKIQRKDRKHRVVSTHETVYDYTYLMEDSVEDRKMEIIAKKKGYHDAIFKGIINDEALSSRMNKDDLLYMLLGQTGEREL